MSWYIHACPNCGGDLHDDVEDKGWARCLQCSRTYRAKNLTDAPEATEAPVITPRRRRRLRPESLRPASAGKRSAA